jgi:hypothetical protein
MKKVLATAITSTKQFKIAAHFLFRPFPYGRKDKRSMLYTTYDFSPIPPKMFYGLPLAVDFAVGQLFRHPLLKTAVKMYRYIARVP